MSLASLKGILYRKFHHTKVNVYPKTRTGQLLYMLKQQTKDGYPKFSISGAKEIHYTPSIEELRKRGMMYPLIIPYAFAYIFYDEKENMINYNIIEPKLTDNENKVFKKLKEGLIQIINVSLDSLHNEQKALSFIEEKIKVLLKEYGITLSEQEYLKIMYYVFRDFIGLNELEPLLRDPYIEDIGMDGVGVPIFIVHQKYGSIKTNIIYNNPEQLREFVVKLAERCGRYISYAEPLLDGSLPDGTRIQASLASDVTTRGPTFSLRKFKEIPLSPIDLLVTGEFSDEMLAYLWFVVENGANILIAGGVATGKTTILNAISVFIPPEAKIVSIEDTRELNIPHENWIPGVVRIGFGATEVGEITMFQLLKESFRQNPDYLIVGEIRGKEAYVMFQGMASGHPCISTMHSGSVDDVIKRLQTQPINLSPGLLESLDIVMIMIHAREKGKSARRVKEIVEIENIDKDSGIARSRKSFVWLPMQDTFEYRGDSWVLNQIAQEKGLQMTDVLKDISKRKKLIDWMFQNNITDIKEVSKYISSYHLDPSSLNKILGDAGNADRTNE